VAGRSSRDRGRPWRQPENGRPNRYGRDCASQSDRDCPSKGVLFVPEHAHLPPYRLRLDLPLAPNSIGHGSRGEQSQNNGSDVQGGKSGE
jgi:hypothetical protein